MDVIKTLRELYEEKRRLDVVIASLEANLDAQSAKSARRRGRKGMSPQERRKVSMRMTLYWENRRAKMRAAEAQTPAGTSELPNAASSESANA